MHDLCILAINLDRSVDRWRRIEEGFSKLPWPLERIRAVDAVDVEQTLAFRGQRLDLPPNAVGWSMPRRRAFTSKPTNRLKFASGRGRSASRWDTKLSSAPPSERKLLHLLEPSRGTHEGV